MPTLTTSPVRYTKAMNEFNMISTRHNYDDGYIGIVNIELDNLPPTFTIGEYELTLKSEFHISLVCVKKIAPLIDPENVSVIEAEIVEAFKEFIQSTPLTNYTLTDQFRLVRRDDRATLVVLAKVLGIEAFFAKLEEKYDKKLPVQVTHITLYTLQPETAIGIISQEDLERLSEPADISLSLA